MVGQVTAKELVTDMEHLLKLLHKEWERSGKTSAEVTISVTETAAVNHRLISAIKERESQLEKEELTFKQSMKLSRENFVLLRLVKKIKKAEEKTNQKGLDLEFMVALDKAEYKIFKGLIRMEE